MATKEVMVSAPLVALLYDRTFLAGSFREAVRRRYGLYLALAATWPLLEQLIYASWGRGNTAGFDAGVNCWSYWACSAGPSSITSGSASGLVRSCWITARAWPKGSCRWRLARPRSCCWGWARPWRSGGVRSSVSWGPASSPSWPPRRASSRWRRSRWPSIGCTFRWPR